MPTASIAVRFHGALRARWQRVWRAARRRETGGTRPVREAADDSLGMECALPWLCGASPTER